jgi:hypothetical protein
VWIKETYLNESKGYVFGDAEWYESYHDTIGSLFRGLQRDYGRCTGRMYVDRPSRFDGPDSPIQVGWIFEKKMVYEDSRQPYKENDYYLRAVWVEVSITEPKRINYMDNITSPWLGK